VSKVKPLPKTLFEKLWDAHVVYQKPGHPAVLYIDAHLTHEVTTPQAYDGLRERKLPVFRTDRTWATMDHNVPTKDQDQPIAEPLSRLQVDKLIKNCEEFGVRLYGLGHPYQGIVHVIGPELGITKPGMTIVCGDSHTSTHGAFGSIAFGIGTSEVEQVLASQCILQNKPKTMNIRIDGKLGKGVVSKDIILYIISKITASGGTGYFVEYSGSAIEALSMEARMTICNMSIEMGARGGLIAPDETTYAYIKGRKFAPKGADWNKAVAYWKTLKTDPGAKYDKTLVIDAADIEPMITYGTNPGMGMGITASIPTEASFNEANQRRNFHSSLEYMGLLEEQGKPLAGHPVDYVFLGSCTNARIEDFRMVADIVRGKRSPDGVHVYVVPGSAQVARELEKEGLSKVFTDAGFDLRGAGCSACLGMNEDKIPAGKYVISTSNRNFQGRQGPGARTFLASPITAAAAAITGKVNDVRAFL
jgi:3-isopropylmalate/(R)-2-methylmalate dehydratase large subunit